MERAENLFPLFNLFTSNSNCPWCLRSSNVFVSLSILRVRLNGVSTRGLDMFAPQML